MEATAVATRSGRSACPDRRTARRRRRPRSGDGRPRSRPWSCRRRRRRRCVTKRDAFSCAESLRTSSSRPTIRPRRCGQVCVGEGRGDAGAARWAGSPVSHDRGDEAIASPGESGDVAGAVLPIAERLAQAGHVEPQAAFLDDDVGPDPGHEIVLADDLVGRASSAIRMSSARAPSSTGAPSLVSSRSLASKQKGPKDRMSWAAPSGLPGG